MSEHWVETRVGRLRVGVIGDGPDRPTALLWHSLFVDERTWGRVSSDLARERRLLVVSGPGHGSSGDPGRRYSIEDCAEAALDALRSEAVHGPVDWVGNSWGGHVGVLFAARHPDRVRTLVAAGAPFHPYRLADRITTWLLVLLYRRLGPVPYLTHAVAEALLSERTRATDPAAVALVVHGFVNADRARMTNAVISVSLNRRDLKTALPAIQAPTLLITGSAHPDLSPEQLRSAAALLPRGTTRVIDNAAYLVPLEAPAEFADAVLGHWAAHPATSPEGPDRVPPKADCR